MPKAKNPRPRYELLSPERRLVKRGAKLLLLGGPNDSLVEWTIIGWDDRKRFVIIDRALFPGEVNLSPTGLPMNGVVRELPDKTRYEMGYRWQLITHS